MNPFDNALTTLKLQADLKKFGLNPAEWSMQKVKSSLGYLIKNRTDESFAMYGELEYRKRKPSWKSIIIISI